jgi:hypothetical protein
VKRIHVLVVVLIALVVIDLSWTAAVDYRTGSVADRVEGLEADQRSIAAFAGANATIGNATQASVDLYAYHTGSGDAVAVPARVSTIPADGVFLDVQRVAHTTTVQQSVTLAWRVANESEYRPAYRGAVVRLSPPPDWDTVGGGSASLSLAFAFAATDPCVAVNDSVATTGGLSSSGTVVDVEYVREKAVIARERGNDVFLVPSGQRVDVPGIRLVEVSSFEEAARYGLEENEHCLGPTQNATQAALDSNA